MILPVGHEEGGVRRLPWVSFAIMALCVVAFLVSRPSSSAMDQGADELYGAIEFYLEHPYLELPESLAEILGDANAVLFSQEFLEAARATVPRPADESTVREEQALLDRMADEALARLGADTYRRYGLVPDRPTAVSWLTHMFLHAGWLHLLGNLLIFYLAGPFIEDVWGRPLFAAFFLLSGLAAAAFQVLRFPDSTVPMIGASGAIAGVMGAFLVRYWHTRIRFLYVFGLLIRGTFDAPAWVMLPLWFGQQVFFAALTDSLGASEGGVAYWAHIGGFAFGSGAAWAMAHFDVERRYLHPAIESKVVSTVVDHREVEAALDLHAGGNTEGAVQSLGAVVERDPGNQDAVLAYWALAVEAGRPEKAAAPMVALVESELRTGNAALALVHWSELAARVDAPPAGPELLVRLSQLLAREGRRDEAAVALRRAMLEAGSGMTSALALRIARAARDVDATVARGAVRLLLSRPELDPAERARAEQLLDGVSGPRPATGA